MKPTALLLLCFVLTANFCRAQNLVPNPSFEEFHSCPNTSDQVDSCIGWYGVLNTPDYFSLCAPYPISVPDNFVGYQFPFEGTSYVGLITYEWWQFYREVIGTQLIAPMVAGSTYNISMRVSRGNWTNQAYNCSAANKLGIRFTTHPYIAQSPPPIDNYAQVYTDSILTDTLNWILLSWEFIADSSYKYIYIGNFFDDLNTDTAVINAPLGQFGTAYYFIDSVNIACIQGCITALDHVEEQHSINFEYRDQTIKISHSNPYEAIEAEVFNYVGQPLQKVTEHSNLSLDMSNFSTGLYVVVFSFGSKIYNKKYLLNK